MDHYFASFLITAAFTAAVYASVIIKQRKGVKQ